MAKTVKPIREYNSVQIPILCPQSMADALDELAIKRGTSRNAQVREAIRRLLEEEAKKK